MTTTVSTERQAFLDAVMADAEGTRDNSKHLAKDPNEWRVAILDLMDDCRARLVGVNADIKANGPRTYKAHELQQERAALCDQQEALITKLRHVKQLAASAVTVTRQTSSKPPTLERPSVAPGTPFEMARAHLYAALDILQQLEEGRA